MNYFVLILCTLGVLNSCKSGRNVVTTDMHLASEKAQQLFGDRYSLKPNETNTFSIISQKQKRLQDLFPSLIFHVFDHQEDVLILTDTLEGGSIYWIANDEIQAISRSRAKQKKSTYIFNVKDKSKIYR